MALWADHPVIRAGLSGASLLGAAVLWEFAGRQAGPATLAPLSTTLARLGALIVSGELGARLAQSLLLLAGGLTLALLVGLPLGLSLIRWARLRIALEDYVAVLDATPVVALIPIILAISGMTIASQLLVVFLAALPPILVQPSAGVGRGVQAASRRGLMGMIAAEFFLGAGGLGGLILDSARAGDTATLLSALLATAFLGGALAALGRRVATRRRG